MKLNYSYRSEPDDNGTYLITCPELPEVTSFAEAKDQIEKCALDAIEDALAYRISIFEDIPEGRGGKNSVFPSLTTQAKILIQRRMREKAVNRAWLVRELKVPRNTVDRIFKGSPKIEMLEQTAEALDMHLLLAS